MLGKAHRGALLSVRDSIMTSGRILRLWAAAALVLGGSLWCEPAAAGGAPAPIWTGAYVGLHGGVQWSDLDAGATSGLSAQGLTGGVHAGYNFSVSGLIIGLETDVSTSDADFRFTDGGDTFTFSPDWSGTVRGRVGVPFGPALLYATLGYAWSDATVSDRTTKFSDSRRFDGVVYGIGAEAFVLPNLSVRLEALRFDYGSEQISIAGAGGAVEEFDPSDTVVRAGVTFHLN